MFQLNERCAPRRQTRSLLRPDRLSFRARSRPDGRGSFFKILNRLATSESTINQALAISRELDSRPGPIHTISFDRRLTPTIATTGAPADVCPRRLRGQTHLAGRRRGSANHDVAGQQTRKPNGDAHATEPPNRLPRSAHHKTLLAVLMTYPGTRRIAPSVEKWRLGHPHDTPPVPFAVTNFRA
jgi:hypothetical protein